MNIEKIRKEAESELESEMSERLKGKVKDKLRQIKNAEKVLENLKLELQVLLEDAKANPNV